jgi:TPR repeat protein
VLLVCLCSAPATGKEYWTYKTAYDAYDTGEFVLAADIYKRLAKKGDPRAQNDLGFLFTIGHGVEQDFKRAVHWFQKAARLGHAPAMIHLAGSYAVGRGVGKSFIEAHKFYSLAALLTKKRNERQIALGRAGELAGHLTPAQLTTANTLTCRWWYGYQERMGKSGRRLPDATLSCDGN